MPQKSLLKQGMIIILVITVIIGILSATTLFLSVRMAQDTARNVIAKSHDSILERLTTTLTNIENATYAVGYSPSVQTLLTDTDSAFPLLDYQEEVRKMFVNAFACSKAITGISLYDADHQYLLSSGGLNYYAPDALPDQFSGSSEAVYGGAQFREPRSNEQLLLVYPVYHGSSTEPIKRSQIGYLAVTLDASLLQTLIDQGEYVEGTLIAFTDSQGQLIMSNEAMTQETLDALHDASGPNVFRSGVFHTGWTLHCLLSSTSLSMEMLPIMITVGIVFLLLIVLIVWMQRFFLLQILRPLRDLQEFMASAPEGHGRISLSKQPENEMRMVMGVLNNMLDTIERSNEEVISTQTRMLQEETARQQMEIIAYRNQINPHFLYNTFDCIRGIAYMHDAMEIVEISQGLSRMFRYSVKGGDFATLRQELEYLQHYATIINHRFSGRIAIHADVDEQLQDCVVIKLLLQPLVENAVLHGLERVVGEGHVHVTAREEQGMLYLRISDNGQGATRQKLQELQEQIASVRLSSPSAPSAHRGVGLMNIARRLILHYGQAASLQVFQENQQGMTVEIVVPVQKEVEPCTV